MLNLASQLIDEMPDRKLIAERLADSQLYVVKRQLPRTLSRRDFENHEFGAGLSAPSTMTGLSPTVVSLVTTFWYSGGRSVSGASSASFGSCGSA